MSHLPIQFRLILILQEVINCVYDIADAQNLPAKLIFTDAEGYIVNDYDPNVATTPPDRDHMSAYPASGMYMSLYILPLMHGLDNDDNNPADTAVTDDAVAANPVGEAQPKFPIHPANAHDADVLPNDNYFFPLEKMLTMMMVLRAIQIKPISYCH